MSRRCLQILSLLLVAVWTSATAMACPAPRVNSAGEDGLARFTLQSECRKGERLRATYGDTDYAAQFDDSGIARAVVPLAGLSNTVTFAFNDGTDHTEIVAFSKFGRVLRIVLQWEDPVDLDLHILEPGGRPQGAGHASAARRAPSGELVGRLDQISDGQGTTTPFLESYVYPAPRQQGQTVFRVAVEYVSRGQIPRDEYCGDGRFAEIRFTLTVIDQTVRRQEGRLPPVPCGRPLPATINWESVYR